MAFGVLIHIIVNWLHSVHEFIIPTILLALNFAKVKVQDAWSTYCAPALFAVIEYIASISEAFIDFLISQVYSILRKSVLFVTSPEVRSNVQNLIQKTQSFYIDFLLPNLMQSIAFVRLSIPESVVLLVQEQGLKLLASISFILNSFVYGLKHLAFLFLFTHFERETLDEVCRIPTKPFRLLYQAQNGPLKVDQDTISSLAALNLQPPFYIDSIMGNIRVGKSTSQTLFARSILNKLGYPESCQRICFDANPSFESWTKGAWVFPIPLRSESGTILLLDVEGANDPEASIEDVTKLFSVVHHITTRLTWQVDKRLSEDDLERISNLALMSNRLLSSDSSSPKSLNFLISQGSLFESQLRKRRSWLWRYRDSIDKIASDLEFSAQFGIQTNQTFAKISRSQMSLSQLRTIFRNVTTFVIPSARKDQISSLNQLCMSSENFRSELSEIHSRLSSSFETGLIAVEHARSRDLFDSGVSVTWDQFSSKLSRSVEVVSSPVHSETFRFSISSTKAVCQEISEKTSKYIESKLPIPDFDIFFNEEVAKFKKTHLSEVEKTLGTPTAQFCQSYLELEAKALDGPITRLRSLNAAKSKAKEDFKWSVSKWSECDGTSCPGYRTRSATCISGLGEVDNSGAKCGNQPETSQSCEQYTYNWMKSEQGSKCEILCQRCDGANVLVNICSNLAKNSQMQC
jgi:hypothetical protein